MNTDAIISIKPMSKKQSSGPSTQPKYQSAHQPIPFATVLPAICCKPTTTSAPFRSFLATVMSGQPNHSTASQKNFGNKTFRIIHPFHPYKNIEFEIDQVRNLACERRVFFFNQKGRQSSVPLAWTDLGLQDPFVVLSAGRALFQVEDLLGLVRIIREINHESCK